MLLCLHFVRGYAGPRRPPAKVRRLSHAHQFIACHEVQLLCLPCVPRALPETCRSGGGSSSSALWHLDRGRRGGTALRRAHSGAGALAGYGDDPPSCSCDCCVVAERRPDEVVAGAGVKCVPSEDHSSEACGEQCRPVADDTVLRTAAEDQILDYQRFCFFECKPAAGTTSFVGTGCLVLEPSEVRRVVDASGNAMDPAAVYGRAEGPRPAEPAPALAARVEPPPPAGPRGQFAAERREEEPAALLAAGAELRGRHASAAVPGPAAAPSAASQALTQAFEDWGARAREAREQAEAAEKVAAAVQAAQPPTMQEAGRSAGGADPLLVIADVRSAAAEGRAAAKRAAASARTALQALKEASAVNERTAANVAEAELEQQD
uniref:Uncharacterized protein n=1 Tax=Alexandrium monilatum TaxID=311494 RepID=A0A7S4QYQ3_9DINO